MNPALDPSAPGKLSAHRERLFQIVETQLATLDIVRTAEAKHLAADYPTGYLFTRCLDNLQDQLTEMSSIEHRYADAVLDKDWQAEADADVQMTILDDDIECTLSVLESIADELPGRRG